MIVWGELWREPVRRTRAPAVPAALAAASGVATDALAGWSLPCWFGLALAGLAAWAGLHRRTAWSALGLWLGVSAVFGAWHHQCWSLRPADAVDHLASDAGLTVRLVGRVVEPDWPFASVAGEPGTQAVLECLRLEFHDETSRPLSGRVRLVIQGEPVDLPAGRVVGVLGRLAKPATAGNPGDFNYREWLRRQGVDAVLRADAPAAVTVLRDDPGWLDRWRNRRREIRRSIRRVLDDAAAPRTAAVAEALLLGTRSQLPDDVRQAFVESGTLHVLAISGVNVGVVWWGLLVLCRLCGFTIRGATWTVTPCLLGYVALTEGNPPIARAATFALLMQLAELRGRSLGVEQGLGLTVLVVLARNPSDLFDPGAQLSFLSVTTLAQAQRWYLAWRSADAAAPNVGWRWWRALRDWLIQANLATGSVWCATIPLVAWRFHLVSPVGFLLNVVLGPLLLLLLWLGYAWLLALAIVPEASGVLLWCFLHLLELLIRITQWCAQWRLGHLYVPGPSAAWTAVFYLAAGAGLWLRGRLAWLWVGRGLLLWTIAGLVWGLLPSREDRLVCEVLAVGHGLAVVVHAPGGRSLVYDAGSLIGPTVAEEAVCRALWREGRGRLDLLILSHADADHCNAVGPLAQRLSPGTLLAHRTFFDLRQRAVQEGVDAWSAQGGRIEFVAAGDRIHWADDVRLEVWHPPAEFRGPRDNANSLLLCVEFAGRRVLLTGDLEREGLAAVLAQPRRPVDFALAPHHGSRLANSAQWGGWTNPEWVAISASDRQAASRIVPNYPPEAVVLSTAECGRIRCEITRAGEVHVSTFRPGAARRDRP